MKANLKLNLLKMSVLGAGEAVLISAKDAYSPLAGPRAGLSLSSRKSRFCCG